MSISQWCWKLMLRQDGGSQLCTLDIGHHKLHLNSWMSSPQYLRVVRRNPLCQFLHNRPMFCTCCRAEITRAEADWIYLIPIIICSAVVLLLLLSTSSSQITPQFSVHHQQQARAREGLCWHRQVRAGRSSDGGAICGVLGHYHYTIPPSVLSLTLTPSRAVHTTDSVMFIWIDKNDVWICVEYVNRYEYLNTM